MRGPDLLAISVIASQHNDLVSLTFIGVETRRSISYLGMWGQSYICTFITACSSLGERLTQRR